MITFDIALLRIIVFVTIMRIQTLPSTTAFIPVPRSKSPHTTSSIKISSSTLGILLPEQSSDFLDVDIPDALLPPEELAVAFAFGALGLFIVSQSFINSMLEGDDGLGAYLSDGSGYNKSGFRMNNKKRRMGKGGIGNNKNDDTQVAVSGKDPIPWLKLPKLDFVEVAGQVELEIDQEKQDAAISVRLDGLRERLNSQTSTGDTFGALATEKEMRNVMEECGFEYKENFE